MSNTTQGRVYHDIDAGHTTVSVEQGKHGKIITTFVYGLSVRSSNLNVEGIRDGYILAVLAARRFQEGEDDKKTKFIDRLMEIIMGNLQ
jgi:hypothetical protein